MALASQDEVSIDAPSDSQMFHCLDSDQIEAAEARLLQLRQQDDMLEKCAKDLRKVTPVPKILICKNIDLLNIPAHRM
jgi:hypothetical protein